MFKLELRPASSRVMAYFSPVFALLLTVFFGGLLFLALGKIR
jgi:simple sugar transport system permease protein